MSTDSAPAPVPTPPLPPSAIADVSYRNYDGELRLRALRFWTITLATIKANVNRRKMGYWIPAALILVIYFFMGVQHFFIQGIRQQAAAMGSFVEAPANPYALTLYQAQSATLLLVFIAALTVGTASIAADNRANALLVYFARPITRADYLAGKWLGVFLLIAALTVVPSLLLFLTFAVVYNDDGFLKQNPTLILRVLGASLVAPALHASLVIGFSAWSKTPRLAGALYAGFYFVTAILSGTVGRVLLEKDKDGKHPQTSAVVANLSVNGVADATAMNLYDVTPKQVLDRFRGGGRRRNRNRRPAADGGNAAEQRRRQAERERAEAEEAARSERRASMEVPERPNLPAVLLLGGAMIALPLVAAHQKVKAVEVVRG